MKSKTTRILEVLKVFSWIIYIGLCIATGILITSFILTVFVDPQMSKDYDIGNDLTNLYAYSKGHYIILMIMAISLSASKAGLFYKVIQLFSKLNLTHPFSESIASIILKISHKALEIGIVAIVANAYAEWLVKRGAIFSLQLESNEFLFLAGIIYIVAQIFNKGIELQSENELTI